jgi:hypothetical protein
MEDVMVFEITKMISPPFLCAKFNSNVALEFGEIA